MIRLLNISTHGSDLELVGNRWEKAVKLLEKTGFDGYELYPVGNYPYDTIPQGIVGGIHLRFFVILEPIWNGNKKRLLQIFDSEENIEHFYGGLDRDAVIQCYREQLELARKFNCPYVVFHPVHYELDYLYNWNPPWSWESTVDLAAEVINEVVKESQYDGWILFENLWWPGNFRLDSPKEIERLLSRVSYPKSGLVLDTGHILNKNQAVRTEAEGVKYILDTVDLLGEYKSLVKAVHLCKSLSGEYVLESRKINDPFGSAISFWDRFRIATEHVQCIDQHDPFEEDHIQALFDRISPEVTVFEFSFKSWDEWMLKIDKQRKALGIK
jgi:sugar phosphate isomerase/epimerase